MHGDPAFASVWKRQRGTAVFADGHRLAEKAMRRRCAKGDGYRRPYQLPFMADPPAACLDLAGTRLAVNPFLAALHELEMLHRVGDVGRLAIDACFLESGIEELAGGTHEGASSEVLLVARLLADKHD